MKTTDTSADPVLPPLPDERRTVRPVDSEEWPRFVDSENDRSAAPKSSTPLSRRGSPLFLPAAVPPSRRSVLPPLSPPPRNAMKTSPSRLEPMSADRIFRARPIEVRVEEVPSPSVELRMAPSPSSAPAASAAAFSLGQFGSRAKEVVNKGSLGWYVSGILSAVLVVLLLRGEGPQRRTSEPLQPLPRTSAPSASQLMTAGPKPDVQGAAAPLGESITTPVKGATEGVGAASRSEAALSTAPSTPQSSASSDCEALVRAARMDQAAGEHDAAIARYNKALSINPQFFPAAIGLADTQWERGQHATAAVLYRKLLDNFPPSMVPPRVRMRAAD